MASSVVRLTFPAKADYLLLARLALAGVARNLPLGDELLADLKLAVTEACGNAVRHAYGPEGGSVTVVFVVAEGRLEMEVHDDGRGIALREVPSEEAFEAERPLDGGMGLPIIHAIVDELEVGLGTNGRGTVVRMAKTLAVPG